jgi:hypothetical protein
VKCLIRMAFIPGVFVRPRCGIGERGGEGEKC